jgi:hypothetical protein
VASASSTTAAYPASYANDGSRRATNGAIWADSTAYTFSDWLEIDFSGSKTINEIDVVTQQDDYQNPIEPTETQTFSLYGITIFNVEYWTGTAWVAVPNGQVTGNNKVWRKFTFDNITTTKIRVFVYGAADNAYSRIVEVEAYEVPAPPINVALASNGAVASASSINSTYYPASTVINGSRKGTDNGIDGLWVDGTANTFPDTVEVNFGVSRNISEVDVFTIQDTPWAPVEPTETQTFSYYGLTDFYVEYWDGANWVQIPGASVTGNNKVWRKFTFSEISTTRIRVQCTGSVDGWSRMVELEAWGH